MAYGRQLMEVKHIIFYLIVWEVLRFVMAVATAMALGAHDRNVFW
jgi:hypothetical protein